jgi:hypothetical protein
MRRVMFAFIGPRGAETGKALGFTMSESFVQCADGEME